MLYFSSIRAVFVDFDDTLCVHLTDRNHFDDYDEWLRAMITSDLRFYLNKEKYAVQEEVRDFCKKLKEKGALCAVITWNSSNIVYKPKKNFVDTYCPGLFDNLYITGSREGKLKLIENYCKIYDLKPYEVLVIDDHPETGNEMRNAGFSHLTPLAIVTLMRRGDFEC